MISFFLDQFNVNLYRIITQVFHEIWLRHDCGRFLRVTEKAKYLYFLQEERLIKS